MNAQRRFAIPAGWQTVRLAAILRLAAFAPIIIGCGYVLLMMPGAPAIAVIQATVESVTFRAAIPEMAQIRLTGFAISFEAPNLGANLGFRDSTIASPTVKKPLCLDGILLPEPGSKVTYKRFGTDPVSIVIERTDGKPAATFQITGRDAAANLRRASWIRLEGKSDDDDDDDDSKKGCDGTPTKRLPIYGVAEIGSEMRPAGPGEEPSSGVLIEGTLDIFARALEIGPRKEDAPRIYPASVTSITLPPGSRITEHAPAGAALQPWTGFVRANADEALEVKVTTPAMKLALIRPGVGMQPEVLSIGLFTQLANDPLLISAQIFAALIFSVFQALSVGLGWLAGRANVRSQAKRDHASDNS
jgi:putative Mn2+ efflux pump MntP